MKWAALLLVLCGCRCGDQRLRAACGLPCYDGLAATRGVGACKDGWTDCADAGACVGQVLPSPEVCDGLDNDCNGLVDDGIAPVSCFSICGDGTASCVGGQEVCGAPSALNPDFCYTGAPGTEILLGCHPGVLQCPDGGGECCAAGERTCQGEATPVPVSWDVAFIVPTNWGMGSRFQAISAAVLSWCAADAGERCALLSLPDNDDCAYGCTVATMEPTVLADFGQPLAPAFAGLDAGPLGGSGDVATYDALYDVADVAQHAYNPVALSWSPSAMKLEVMFTDEEGQSYNFPVVLGPADVAGAQADSGVRGLIFASQGAPPSDYGGLGVVAPLDPVDPSVYVRELDSVAPTESCP